MLFAFFLCALASNSGLQAQMKSVQVDFKILETTYQNFYFTELETLETQAAEMLATRFQLNFPFVNFSTEPGDSKLSITLDKQKTQLESSSFHQVDLNLSVPNTGSEEIAFKFRSAEQFFAPLPNSNEAFLQELQNVIDFWLNKENEAIVKDVMSQVSLAENAHPDSDKGYWILPFSEDNLRIGVDSEFILNSKINTVDFEKNIKFEAVSIGKVLETSERYPEHYKGKILASIKNLNEANKREMQSDNLNIEGIYLTKFMRAILAESVDPEEFNFLEN